MNLVEIIKTVLVITAPFIKELFQSKVVPKAQRKAYEVLDTVGDERIESLVRLKEKALEEENPVKKLAYEEGLKLGVSALRAIGQKLIQASDAICVEEGL